MFRQGRARRRSVRFSRGLTRVLTVALALALVAVLAAGRASAGQIVYRHGSDIWAMSDDGSNQHQLLTVGQVPGMSSLGDPNVFANGGTDLAFDATTLAYAAPSGSGPAGACGVNCTGVYTLKRGAVTRLTADAAPCGPTPQRCGSFSVNPKWMANGNITYEYQQYAWDYSCLILPCGWRFSSAVDEVEVIPPRPGAGVGTPWNRQYKGNGSSAVPIVDPADAGRIAYIGALVNCASGCLYPLYISAGNGTYTPVDYDDDLIEAAWSPDGRTFADVSGGDRRGIWTYAADDASTPGKRFVWALEDPIQTDHDPGNNPFDVTFTHVAWVGSSKLVFSAQGNLWSIPASCGQGGTPCQFPRDASRLTTDGTSSAPDTEPSWTSATVTPPVNQRSSHGSRPNTKLAKAKIRSKKRKAIFTFKGVGGKRPYRLECKLTGQSRKLKRWKKCHSPKTYKHLRKGKHVFEVRAIGADGAKDPSPAKKRFKVR